MASPDRNAFEPPYDDHLMFGDADEHEETRGRPLLVLLGMIVIAAFASVIWVAYNQGIKQARDGQPPVLADDSGPARIVPTANETPAPDTPKSAAQVEPDISAPAPAPADTQLAPAPEEPQAIVTAAIPPSASSGQDGATPGDGQIPAAAVSQPAPAAEPVPAEQAASQATPPADLTGSGGPLAATQAVQPRPRPRAQAQPPAPPAPVTEGAPDSTVDTFARPPAGTDVMAGLPAAAVPTAPATAPAMPSNAPVDPLTPSQTVPSAEGAPRQLPVPVEAQAAAATPPAELAAQPPAELSAPATVLPELGPPAEVEIPKIKSAPAVPAKPAKAKVTAEAGSAPGPLAPKTDILDEPFSGQPTGKPTAASVPGPGASASTTPGGTQTAAIAPTAPEPAAVRPAAPTEGGYVVQLGSFLSDADAASSWARIKSNHGNTLDGAAPEIRAFDLGAKGTRYRLRVGAYAARGEATQVCSRLKASGQDCVVTAK